MECLNKQLHASSYVNTTHKKWTFYTNWALSRDFLGSRVSKCFTDTPMFLPLPHSCSMGDHLEVTLRGPGAIWPRRIIHLPRELKLNEALGQVLSDIWLELLFPYWSPVRAEPSPVTLYPVRIWSLF